MSQATIAEQSPGVLVLCGVLDYLNGPALREQGGKLIRSGQASSWVIDCSAVGKSSSVGLSLLLAFARDAAACGKALTIRGLPSDMQGIAKVSELDAVLPLSV